MQEGPAVIEVSGVTHHFGVGPVLRDVSFAVPTGRTLAILGPNGRGKTTLLKLMSGLLSPAFGQIRIDGVLRRSSVEAELAIRAKTYFLPADAWFPPTITGREYVLAVGETWRVPILRLFEHTDQLLELFQLKDISNSLISSYSTGQKRKLALCAALVSEASVLLLDEPFSGGLDPAGLTAIRHILRRLPRRSERTVVLTSPVPELIEQIADDVLILDKGQIQRHATIPEIIASCGASTFDEALRQLIFPETEEALVRYFEHEVNR